MVGVPTILLILCSPSFLLNTPDFFSRHRMYWPQRHFPCVMMSCDGSTGCFHPIVLDSFLVTTSLTLLSRRRANDAVLDGCNEPALIEPGGSPCRTVEWRLAGKLNFRRVRAVALNRSGSRWWLWLTGASADSMTDYCVFLWAAPTLSSLPGSSISQQPASCCTLTPETLSDELSRSFRSKLCPCRSFAISSTSLAPRWGLPSYSHLTKNFIIFQLITLHFIAALSSHATRYSAC